MLTFSRRTALALGAGAALAGTLPSAAFAQVAAANDMADLIKKFTGGKEPAKGKITLDLPEIAENGNTVPLALSVESPMSAEAYVAEVLILADGNPSAGVAKLSFSPLSGKAEASIRIRLAMTQNVVAVAKMNDGSCFTEKKTVKVTIGGCGG